MTFLVAHVGEIRANSKRSDFEHESPKTKTAISPLDDSQIQRRLLIERDKTEAAFLDSFGPRHVSG